VAVNLPEISGKSLDRRLVRLMLPALHKAEHRVLDHEQFAPGVRLRMSKAKA
jgi:hypothetical protein